MSAASPRTAAIVLGIGMGGFVDGILLHQILQVHSMLSARVPRTDVAGLEVNMFWDGLFHAFTWVATIAGIALLWRALAGSRQAPPQRVLWGGMLLGWGLFNLVEGTINHMILGIHHVIEGPGHLPWDIAFLVLGLAQIVAGRRMASGPEHRGNAPEGHVFR